MHGARVIALRGQLRPGAGDRPRARRAAPDRARQLGQPVPDRGPEDGRLRDLRRARAGARRARDPGRQRRQRHRLLARASRSTGRSPILYGFQAEGAAPLVEGHPVAEPGDGRLGDPDRQPGPLGGGDGRRSPPRAAGSRRSPTSRSSTPTTGSPRSEGVFCEPASAASVAGLLAHGLPVAEGASSPRRSSACSPATASRTPTPRSARPPP